MLGPRALCRIVAPLMILSWSGADTAAGQGFSAGQPAERHVPIRGDGDTFSPREVRNALQNRIDLGILESMVQSLVDNPERLDRVVQLAEKIQERYPEGAEPEALRELARQLANDKKLTRKLLENPSIQKRLEDIARARSQRDPGGPVPSPPPARRGRQGEAAGTGRRGGSGPGNIAEPLDDGETTPAPPSRRPSAEEREDPANPQQPIVDRSGRRTSRLDNPDRPDRADHTDGGDAGESSGRREPGSRQPDGGLHGDNRKFEIAAETLKEYAGPLMETEPARRLMETVSENLRGERNETPNKQRWLDRLSGGTESWAGSASDWFRDQPLPDWKVNLGDWSLPVPNWELPVPEVPIPELPESWWSWSSDEAADGAASLFPPLASGDGGAMGGHPGRIVGLATFIGLVLSGLAVAWLARRGLESRLPLAHRVGLAFSIDPRLRGRERIRQQFEALALGTAGPAARSRNHRVIEMLLRASLPQRAQEVHELANLYEQARYAPAIAPWDE